MPVPAPFDRSRIRFRPVAERKSKFRIDDIAIGPETPVREPDLDTAAAIEETAQRVAAARQRGAPVMICHGAHLIKNGLGPLLIRFVEDGWLTHLATNGAGGIHDWEFAHLGRSTEDVRANVAVGEFGIWEETGALTGLALLRGALDGIGYGAALGRLIAESRLEIPERADLAELTRALAEGRAGSPERAAAAAELLELMDRGLLKPGWREVAHPWRHRSILAACWERQVPFTVHPGIGQDIIYSHPLVTGAGVGRAAMTDFLLYAAAVERLQGGVYLSVGSAVVSPMIFEKSLSMARNVLLPQGRNVDDFSIVVNDLARVDWDWSRGEPPVEHPAYYVRFMKTFWRMGGTLRYVGLDNRAFLIHLYRRLSARRGKS